MYFLWMLKVFFSVDFGECYANVNGFLGVNRCFECFQTAKNMAISESKALLDFHEYLFDPKKTVIKIDRKHKYTPFSQSMI